MYAIRSYYEQAELDEEEWTAIEKSFEEALERIDEFRIQEGKVLYNEIISRIDSIRNLASQIEPFEKERIERVRERILDQLNEIKDKINKDENRFEQEMIYYLEKLDITEEKVRLSNRITSYNVCYTKLLRKAHTNQKKLTYR